MLLSGVENTIIGGGGVTVTAVLLLSLLLFLLFYGSEGIKTDLGLNLGFAIYWLRDLGK